jgi:hypothetical protein
MTLTLWRPTADGGDAGAGDALGDATPPGPERSPVGFASALALGLADLSRDDLADDSLVLALSVSAWLRQTGVGLTAARTSLFALRRAVLAASELDAASEPIPLAAGDPGAAVLGLARYLWDVLDRAARRLDGSRRRVATGALDLLEPLEEARTG